VPLVANISAKARAQLAGGDDKDKARAKGAR